MHGPRGGVIASLVDSGPPAKSSEAVNLFLVITISFWCGTPNQPGAQKQHNDTDKLQTPLSLAFKAGSLSP